MAKQMIVASVVTVDEQWAGLGKPVPHHLFAYTSNQPKTFKQSFRITGDQFFFKAFVDAEMTGQNIDCVNDTISIYDKRFSWT